MSKVLSQKKWSIEDQGLILLDLLVDNIFVQFYFAPNASIRQPPERENHHACGVMVFSLLSG
jgi:hypothetical protein